MADENEKWRSPDGRAISEYCGDKTTGLDPKVLGEQIPSTPSSEWHKNGHPDPHGERFNCERAKLEMGDLTDDALANAFYLYDHRRGFESMKWLDAAKCRIRWLSRALERALAGTDAPVPDGCYLISLKERSPTEYAIYVLERSLHFKSNIGQELLVKNAIKRLQEATTAAAEKGE